MSLEELLVDCHVFEPHNVLAGFELRDPVHQQKRITVRQELHDLDAAVNGLVFRLRMIIGL